MSDSTTRCPKTCCDQQRLTSFDADVTALLSDTSLSLDHQTTVIGRMYTFALDDANTRLDAQGRPYQLAIRLTRRTQHAETLLVVCKAIGTDHFWFIQDMQNACFEAGAYIAAVKLRIARNRAQRDGG